MAYPRVTADLGRLKENIARTAALCVKNGLGFAAVTKCVSADPIIVGLLEESGCQWLADARLKNLASYHTEKPRFLIRPAQRWEIPEVTEHADISLQSDKDTIRLLGEEAARLDRRHKVILACDLGDLREGCFFRDERDILETAEAVLQSPALELYGVGMNLSCFGGVLPCRENMTGLVQIAEMLRDRFSEPIPIVSGGSSCLIWEMLEGTVSPGLNHCRIGELWLAGHDAGRNTDVPGFDQGCFTLEAQLIEVKTKPSKPIGPIGGDAFGHVIERPDLGPMRRGIIAIGRQDLDPECAFPLDGRVRVLGSSSDHTILDLTDAPEYRTGDVLSFRLGYGGILRAYTSPYVERRYTGIEA